MTDRNAGLPNSRMAPAMPLPDDGDRIARRSLHDEVVARLRHLIVRSELRAGERIPERILSLLSFKNKPLTRHKSA